MAAEVTNAAVASALTIAFVFPNIAENNWGMFSVATT
jgi:hypothetical protein